jgi:hypothetical protein
LQYSADPVVQVFDLRMPERAMPLAATSVIPSFVRFLPPGPAGIRRLWDKDEERDDMPSVLAVSADGYMQVDIHILYKLNLLLDFLLDFLDLYLSFEAIATTD